MGESVAITIVEGDRVRYRSELRRVMQVRVGEAGPEFYLVRHGWVSWKACGRYTDGKDQPTLFGASEPSMF